MTPVLYIVKKRSMEAARRNSYGHKVRYGKWLRVSAWATEVEAITAKRLVQGLYDVGVFHKGKRIY